MGIGWIVWWLGLIVVGALAIALPLLAGLLAALVMAWALILGGVLQLGGAWHPQRLRSRLWHVLLGLLYLASGLYLALVPGLALASLTLLLALVFFVGGIMRLIAWSRHRDVVGAGWLLADGLVTLLLGLMIGFGWPASSVWAPGTLLGIALLFNGVSGMMFTLSLRRSGRLRL